jgi:integrase
VADIDVSRCLQVLEPIWFSKTETATRVRQRIETVLTWGKVAGYRTGENPAAWRGNLKELLPDPAKIRKVCHYPALLWQRVPDFMRALAARSGPSALALQFVILTAVRSNEARNATWGEVDLDAGVWTIPAERMKSGVTHRVPLCGRLVSFLESLRQDRGSSYLFPSPIGGPLHDIALSSLIGRMNAEGDGLWIDPTTGKRATVHGFRSSFKDWARSATGYPDEASELQLAHINSASTRAAYARDELLEQRRAMLAEWTRFALGE